MSKLDIADKLALIYTSAGSLRKTAALAGLSHQQVSRILHKRAQGLSIDSYSARPEISAGVEVAFQIHKDVASQVAKDHGLPFDRRAPVFVERLPLQQQGVLDSAGRLVFKGSEDDAKAFVKKNSRKGSKLERVKLLGERVGALHLHWLSDDIRNRWIATTQQTGFYYSASVGSKVNLPQYVKTAAARIDTFLKRGGLRTEQQIKARQQLKNLLRDKVDIQRVFTPYTPLDPRFPPELVVRSINQELEKRHAPAIGAEGTAFADQILLQVDTRKTKHETEQREARRNKGVATKRRSK